MQACSLLPESLPDTVPADFQIVGPDEEGQPSSPRQPSQLVAGWSSSAPASKVPSRDASPLRSMPLLPNVDTGVERCGDSFTGLVPSCSVATAGLVRGR